MKKIVITGTRGIPHIMGGVEAVVEEIAPRLVGLGYDVTVIRRSAYVNDHEKSWEGVRLIDIDCPKKKSLEAFAHTWKAIWLAKKMHADIVHINAIGPALLTPLAKVLGLKVVFHHHGPDYDRDKWGKVAKLALRAGEWMGCHFADSTIVISEVIKQHIENKYPKTRNLTLVYNGVAKPCYTHMPEYFSELGIEEGKYILAMCRFVPEKRLHDLLEAFGEMNTPVKLVLAGDADFEDSYSKELKDRAREMGVVLTGFVQGEKKSSLLTNALCYCLPSSHEGLPIALLEAMSYGLKVVASSIPANLEVGLPEDCYHKVGDVQALRVKLEGICSQPVERVSYRMEKYNWDTIASQISNLY